MKPQCLSGLYVLQGVVDEDGRPGFNPQSAEGHLEGRRIGLDHPLVAGAENNVEQIAYIPIRQPVRQTRRRIGEHRQFVAAV